MKKVVIYGPFQEKERKAFQDVSKEVECIFLDNSTDEKAKASVLEANAVIGNYSIPWIVENKKLEWMQLTSSGADAYAKAKEIPSSLVITTATGAYGVGIAEYMVAMLLNMMKKVPGYLELQKKKVWRDLGQVDSPFHKRVLILGMGNIGKEFAKRMRAFGSHIVGIRRRVGTCPEEFDEVYGIDQLKEQLAIADIIALALPGTPETRHLLDEETLSCCKEGAYLMNVGRGNVIPMEALTNKSVTNRFSGIWIDVCEVEPLPDGHQIYDVENLLITPHITGGTHLSVTIQNIFEISYYNYKAWINGTEYKSILDRSTGYCK